VDLSDLEERVKWAIANDVEAQAIVRRANRFMAEETRQEDHDCFWFRFLLEYGSIFDNRE
jgi:Glycosyl transferase family 90